MPLYRTPNQPLFSDPNAPNEPFCEDYCKPFFIDDPLYAQFTQTPCGANETCSEDFTAGSLNNIITEDFTVACPSLFTLGGGWSCTVNGLTGGANGPLSNAEIADPPGAGQTQYKMYKVSVTIDSRTQGAIEILLGNAEVSTGYIEENGTSTYYLLVTTDVSIVGNDKINILASGDSDGVYDAHFDGNITDFTVDEVNPSCWSNGSGTWWMTELGGASKIRTGLTGDLKDDLGGNYLTAGKYYKLTVVVSEYTSGSVTPKVGGTAGDDISSAGTFERYIVAGASTTLAFTPTSDFLGKIESVDVRELKYTGDITVTLLDLDFNEIGDISTYLSFYNEYITLCVTPYSDLGLEDGCYQIGVFDNCNLADPQYSDFVINGGFDDAGAGWTPQIGTQWDPSGNTGKVTYDALPQQNATTFVNSAYNEDFFLDTNYPPGTLVSNYNIQWTVVSRNATVGAAADITAGVLIGNQSSLISYQGPGTHNYNVTVPVPYSATTDAPRKGRVQYYAQFLNGAQGDIVVDNIIVTKLSPYQATYYSDCFQLYDTPPSKSKLFIGTCETEKFGFEFANSGFKLLQRIECRALAPSWPGSVSQYQRSNGNKKVDYAELERLYELFIEATNWSTHGAIAVQIKCDSFIIGDTESDTTEYIVEADEYVPEFDRSGASDIGPSRIQVRIKDGGMIFNRKC